MSDLTSYENMIRWFAEQNESESFGMFKLLYSNNYGLPWDYDMNVAETIFVRTFPPLVELIDSQNFQMASDEEKLEMLGFDTTQVEKNNNYNPYIPSDLPVQSGSIVEKFIQEYQKLFPKQWEKKTQQTGFRGTHSVLQFNPKELLCLNICKTDNITKSFGEFDGQEMP